MHMHMSTEQIIGTKFAAYDLCDVAWSCLQDSLFTNRIKGLVTITYPENN
jgi:hypothetical protein